MPRFPRLLDPTSPVGFVLFDDKRRRVTTGFGTGIPPAMPVYSFGLPGKLSGSAWFDPARALDTDMNTDWRQVDADPQWFAVDISTVPDAQKATSVFHWFNKSTGMYWQTAVQTSNTYNNLPRDYTIDSNTAAGGGAAPTTGWVTEVTVTGNTYRSRTHTLHLTGKNWVRINVTASNGAPGNDDAAFQILIHNAALGLDDQYRMLGDSITQDGLAEARVGGGNWQHGNVAQQINNVLTDRYPVFEDGGVIGMNVSWVNTNKASLLSGHTGRFVGVAIGTNDANQAGALTAGQISAYQTDLLAIVDYIISLGKTPIVANIPWGSANAGMLGTNANTLNTQVISALWADATRPTVVRGPDLYTLFNTTQNLIGTDGIHPTLDVGGGYDQMIDLWAQTLLVNVYQELSSPLAISGLVNWYSAKRSTITLAAGNASQFTAANSEYLSGTGNATVRGAVAGWWRSFWFYLDSAAANAVILSCLSGNTGYQARLNATGDRLVLQVGNGTAVIGVTEGTALVTGTWYHGYIQYDGTNIGVSVNNAALTTGALGAAYPPGSASFIIGATTTPSQYWDGRIQYVHGADGVLTAGQRTSDRNGGTPLLYSYAMIVAGIVPTFFYPLGEQVGVREDILGNGPTLNDNNTVTAANGLAVDAISQINDLSTSGLNLSTATQANRHMFRSYASKYGSLPCMVAPNTVAGSTSLAAGSTEDLGTTTIFDVCAGIPPQVGAATPGQSHRLVGGTANNGVDVQTASSGQIRLQKQGVASILVSTAPIGPFNAPHVFDMSYTKTSGAADVYANGTLNLSGTSVQTISVQTFALGGVLATSSWQHASYEACAYNRVLTAAERNQLRRYFAREWFISGVVSS